MSLHDFSESPGKKVFFDRNGSHAGSFSSHSFLENSSTLFEYHLNFSGREKSYHLNFSGREKSIIRLKLFYCDRDGYHCEKEGTISVQVTLRQEAANCKSFARSSMSVAKLGNVFV